MSIFIDITNRWFIRNTLWRNCICKWKRIANTAQTQQNTTQIDHATATAERTETKRVNGKTAAANIQIEKYSIPQFHHAKVHMVYCKNIESVSIAFRRFTFILSVHVILIAPIQAFKICSKFNRNCLLFTAASSQTNKHLILIHEIYSGGDSLDGRWFFSMPKSKIWYFLSQLSAH